MKNILFDLDLTLIKTFDDNQDYINKFRTATRKKLIDLGIPKTELENIVTASSMQNKAQDCIKNHYNKAQAIQLHKEIDERARRKMGRSKP